MEATTRSGSKRGVKVRLLSMSRTEITRVEVPRLNWMSRMRNFHGFSWYRRLDRLTLLCNVILRLVAYHSISAMMLCGCDCSSQVEGRRCIKYLVNLAFEKLYYINIVRNTRNFLGVVPFDWLENCEDAQIELKAKIHIARLSNYLQWT